MRHFLKSILQDPKHALSRHLAGGALGTFGLNVINQLLVLGCLMLMARMMSVSEFGIYSVLISLITLLALPFTSGMPVFTLRHVSAYMATQDYGHARGFIRAVFLWLFFASSFFRACVFAMITAPSPALCPWCARAPEQPGPRIYRFPTA